MQKNIAAYRGCFLGMAIGDAMGATADEMSLQEIFAEFGPDGLLGYDLRNDVAAVTSYTQVATYVANGLLLYVTRGKPGTQMQFLNNHDTIHPKAQTSILVVIFEIICSSSPISEGSKHSGAR